MTNWEAVEMYDDGTNGDQFADDHIWSVLIEDISPGEHQWGAISTNNGDGSVCVACDGSDGWGTWLIDGSNPSFSLSNENEISGQTSYTIEPFTTVNPGTITFTLIDYSEVHENVHV